MFLLSLFIVIVFKVSVILLFFSLYINFISVVVLIVLVHKVKLNENRYSTNIDETDANNVKHPDLSR